MNEFSLKTIVMLDGQPFGDMPADLYIPPDALEVFLDMFMGPFDLLLYLIKKQNLDILNIPIAAITHQYMAYIQALQASKFELAAEYLVMAATLAEIKSRMLLPRQVDEGEEEADPRAELVRKLLEYEQIKHAAIKLDEIPRLGRDCYEIEVEPQNIYQPAPPPALELQMLFDAFKEVLLRCDLNTAHFISREPLSVRERMSAVLEKISEKRHVIFSDLFNYEEGRAGVVVTFLAILELAKASLIQILQNHPFTPIYLQLVEASHE